MGMELTRHGLGAIASGDTWFELPYVHIVTSQKIINYRHWKVVNILTALSEQQTPSLDFWGLDLHLYTKCQQMKKKKLFQA